MKKKKNKETGTFLPTDLKMPLDYFGGRDGEEKTRGICIVEFPNRLNV